MKTEAKSPAMNVLGSPLESCCMDPMTGFFRTGFCETNQFDQGRHLVCCILTEEFLTHSKETGNDLSTPRPEFDFPGLKPGDRWCVCAERWVDAHEANVAPPIVLEATHSKMLEHVSLMVLKQYALQ